MNCYDPTNPFGYMPELPDDLTEDERKLLPILYPLCGCATMGVVFFILMLLCLLFGSCTTTKYVPVETIRTEYRTQHDTIRIADSTATERISILQQVDSSYLHQIGIISPPASAYLLQTTTNKHTATALTATHTDTVTVEREVQVPYPVEVIKEVEKPLTWWQRVRLALGDLSLITAVAAAIVLFLRLKNKILP